MLKIILITIAIGLIGCLLHFTYEWSGRKKFVALFSAVNESTWEHIKIALIPTLIFCLLSPIIYGNGYFYMLFGELHFYFSPQFFVPMAATLLATIVLIPLLFYSILAIMKKHNVIVSIIEFFVTIFLSQIIFVVVMDMPGDPFSNPFLGYCGLGTGLDGMAPCYTNSTIILSAAIIALIILAVLLFTFFPPKIFLFRDPINKKYGLAGNDKNHSHHKKSAKKHHH